MNIKDKPVSFFTPVFLHLTLINFFFMMAYSSLNLLPEHLRNIGASDGYIGFFMTIPALELAVFVIFFSSIIKKIKRKTLIIIGGILFILMMILMFVFYKNLILLLIFALISGAFFAFSFTLVFSLVYDIIPQNKRTGAVAIYGISGVLSSPIGSFLGENINKHLHAGFLFLLSAFFCFITIILVLFVNEKSYSNEDKNELQISNLLLNYRLYPFFYIAMILGGAFGIFTAFIPNFSEERIGYANLSVFFISFSIITILIRLFIFSIIDKISKKILVIFSLLFMLFPMIYITFLSKIWQFIIIGIVYGIGHSIMFPTLSSLFVNKAVTDGEKTLYNNVFLAFYTIGLMFFTTVFGFMGDLFRMESIFLSMAIVISGGIITAVIMHNKKFI